MMEIYGVGPIPKPDADAAPQQWLDYGLVVAMLHASDRSDVPVKEVARAYLAKWPQSTKQQINFPADPRQWHG